MVQNIAGLAQFQAWLEPSFELGTVVQVPGVSLRLLGLNNNALVGMVLAANGVPSFYVMDENLQIRAPEILMEPTGLKAAVTLSQIDLWWNDITGKASYSVERKQTTNWVEIGSTDLSVTTYSDGFMKPGNEYQYRVVVKNGEQTSQPSEFISVRFGPPLSPSNLTATAYSASAIYITWTESNATDSYLIERAKGSGTYWRTVATLEAGASSYNDTGLRPGTGYSYRLSAMNNACS